MYYPLQAQKLTHPIDQLLHNCLTAIDGQTIDGMVGCMNIAHEKWEQEMEYYLNLLMAKLNDSQKNALKHSQESWLKFREMEYKYLESLYSTKKASSYKPILAEEKMNITKVRSIELKEYYEILSTE